MSDFFSKLSEDVPELVASGVMTKAQAEKLLAHYREESERKPSRLVPILSILGSVFVGLGFILYFAANWDSFSDVAKLAILSVATLSVHAAAYVMLYVRDLPKTGHALALLGSILYGASIFLIGQTYNLGGTFPEAMLLWLAGVVPMAYVTGLSSFPFLLSALFGTWVFGHVAEHSSWYASENALVWFPTALGTFLVGLGAWHAERYPAFRAVFVRLGLFAVFSGLFLLTFDGMLDNADTGSYGAKTFAVLFGAGTLAYAARILAKRDFSVPALLPLAHVAVVGALAYVAYLLPDRASWYSSGYGIADASGLELAALVATNLYFVAFAIAATALGTFRKEPFVVNVSLAFIAVFVFAKYFDWFFDMMDRALFFIVGGTLFVLVGWYLERRRKILVKSISE